MTEARIIRVRKIIRERLYGAEWWRFVSDEVRPALENIIENIDVIGLLYKDAFLALFAFENARRQVAQISLSKTVSGALFDTLSEEVYQSAISPTKFVLQLPDWTNPNDADVNSAIMLTTYIEEFETTGVLRPLSQIGKNTNAKKNQEDQEE